MVSFATVVAEPREARAAESAGAAPPCFDDLNRYVDCGNGTVTDTVTGLVWLRNANCFGGSLFYADANRAAAALAEGQCGLTDGSAPGAWRLPTARELNEMVRYARKLGCSDPALTDVAGTACFEANPPFGGVKSAGYWSSSSVESEPDDAFGLNLHHGFILSGGKGYDGPYYVWPVRAGR
jgi:hypothetical protein